MKTCACGGKWYRHDISAKGNTRYRCSVCRKTITVDLFGRISTLKGRPMKADWRTA